MVKGVAFFKQMLHGHPFVIVTDNSALSFIKSSKDSLDKYARWTIFLEEFDFRIEHRTGNNNIYADALTRLSLDDKDMVQQASVFAISSYDLDEGKKFVAKLRHDVEMKGEGPRTIPEQYKKFVLDHFHKEKHNHIGIKKMIVEMRRYCTVPKLQETVRHYLQGCKPCLVVNSKNKKEGLIQPMQPIGANLRWFSDVLGPLPPMTGENSIKYSNILVIVDQTSRYGQAYVMASINTQDLIRKFTTAFEEYGRPLELITDNGPSYCSWLFKEFLRKNDIKHIVAPVHHQSSNGTAERFIKTIYEALLKEKVDGNADWAANLPQIIEKYNKTHHSITGRTPNDLLNGIGDKQSAIEKSIKQQQYDARRINKRRRPAKFTIGDNVLLDVPQQLQKKFSPKRIGPFKITAQNSKAIYKTDRPIPGHAWNSNIHANNLKGGRFS